MNQSKFSKLQKHWYDKLKDDGFKDIEHESGLLDRSYTKNKKEPIEIEVIQHYYSMAMALLNDYKFDNEVDKTIWAYHAEGLSLKEISNVLIKSGIKKRKRVTVSKIINKLIVIMKLKYLSP